MRTIIIGDIHGCIDEFQALVRLVEYRQNVDILVLAGDLVDRGPDSAGVVSFAEQIGAVSVLGNHDEWHVRWRRHEAKRASKPDYKNPMEYKEHKVAVNKTLSDANMAWLEKLPLFYRVRPDMVVVHGGISFYKTAESEDPKRIIRLRYVYPDGKMARLDPNFQPPPGSVFWTKLWHGPDNVVYGHNVDDLDYPRIDDCCGIKCYGLDTGCCFGGKLTAMVIDGTKEPEFVQVQAKQTYYEMGRVLTEEV